MTVLSPTSRSTVRRLRERAQTDRAALYDVLGAALVCHLSVVVDGSPLVLPTAYGFDEDTLYVHGSTGSRSLQTAGPVCVAVTVLDGVVYARSVFHHSMNYRSAVVHGHARQLHGEEKLRGLELITEHLAPGSWSHARLPNKKELAQTNVLALDLHEASVKVRRGGPKDDDADLALPVWAGVLPIREAFGIPEPCELLPDGARAPEYVEKR